MDAPEEGVVGELPVARALAVRLEVDGPGGSVDTRRLVEDTLRGIPGVLDVTTDAGTGGIAIRYEPQPSVEPDSGGARIPTPVRSARPRVLTLARILETVIVVALEVVLQRFLGPLFWPRRC
jgi:hypothetical protein